MPINPSDPPSGGMPANLCVWNMVVAIAPNPVPIGTKPAIVGSYVDLQRCSDVHWNAWTEIKAYREDPQNPGSYIWKQLGSSAIPPGDPVPTTSGPHNVNWTTDDTLEDLGFMAGEIMQIVFHIRCSGCTARQEQIYYVPLIA